jgi:hypothetical protein
MDPAKRVSFYLWLLELLGYHHCEFYLGKLIG